MNAVVDCLGVYKSVVSGRTGELLAPHSLRNLPLYIISLMKQVCYDYCITMSFMTIAV